jgi:hypothetical protein
VKKDKSHKGNDGFKVPENYFVNFESKLSQKINSDIKRDNHLSSKIDSGFKIPENYFTSLENALLQKINKNKPKGKLISLQIRKNVLYLSGIAAMIAIIISISVNKKSKLNFNTIEIADIHIYLNEEDIELSTNEIAALLDSDIIYSETFEKELIDDETLLEYLSEEDIDDEIIFTE